MGGEGEKSGTGENVGPRGESPMKCLRCGAELQDVGSGMGGIGWIYYVVPRILVLTCPSCGYSKQSWA
jgi:hypothetical protein